MTQFRKPLIHQPEQLLIARDDVYFKLRVTDADLKVGDVFYEHFTTTSPPTHVTNAFRVTSIDNMGLWGHLIESSVQEMELSEV